MKRFVILVATLLLLSLATPIFAEIELGASLTPASYLKTEANVDMEKNVTEQEGSFLADMIFGFHVGYSWWWLFYASWDSYVMPPWWIFNNVAVYKPGFLNLFDLGIRPVIGPIILMAEIGVNQMYIYKQAEDKNVNDVSFGANMRVGAGLKFNWWSLSLTGTSVFVDFDTMADVLTKVGKGNPKATNSLLATIIPSLTFNVHF